MFVLANSEFSVSLHDCLRQNKTQHHDKYSEDHTTILLEKELLIKLGTCPLNQTAAEPRLIHFT